MTLKFALIGDGTIAKYHKEAIKHVGGEIKYIFDPKYNTNTDLLSATHFPHYIDYAVILSPSQFHRQQIKELLETGHILRGIICEKPAFLPWEPSIDDNRINIVLQLRYLPNLPEKADLVSVRFVRDEAYFKSWKGDARNTGGLFYSLFIHYIKLAIDLKANFVGEVACSGEQIRKIDNYDILKVDTQELYNKMYKDIIFNNNGTKPQDLFLLNWILDRCSFKYGLGKEVCNKKIELNLKDFII